MPSSAAVFHVASVDSRHALSQRPENAPQRNQLQHAELPVHKGQQLHDDAPGECGERSEPDPVQQSSRHPTVSDERRQQVNVVRGDRGSRHPHQRSDDKRRRLGLRKGKRIRRGMKDGCVPVSDEATCGRVGIPRDRPGVKQRDSRRLLGSQREHSCRIADQRPGNGNRQDQKHTQFPRHAQ